MYDQQRQKIIVEINSASKITNSSILKLEQKSDSFFEFLKRLLETIEIRNIERANGLSTRVDNIPKIVTENKSILEKLLISGNINIERIGTDATLMHEQKLKLSDEIISLSKISNRSMQAVEQKFIFQSDVLKQSLDAIQKRTVEKVENLSELQNKLREMMSEYKKNIDQLSISVRNRDAVSDKYLNELSKRSDELKATTETIYKDHDLLLELLKAGLMNDLIKDMKQRVQ
jgi:hypothetical protein